MSFLPWAADTMSFAQGRLGLVHSMSHGLSAIYDTAQGLANAVLLTVAMEFNAQVPEVASKFARMAQALGVDTNGMTEKESVAACVEKVREISDDCGIPSTLNEIGAKIEDVDTLVEYTLENRLLLTNPIHIILTAIRHGYMLE